MTLKGHHVATDLYVNVVVSVLMVLYFMMTNALIQKSVLISIVSKMYIIIINIFIQVLFYYISNDG